MKSKAHLSGEPSMFTYTMAFFACVILTLAAYFAVTKHILKGPVLIVTIIVFGLIQAAVQLIVFLHLGKEDKPKWNLLIFSFMALVLVVIVFGSLWIMYNLDYRMEM